MKPLKLLREQVQDIQYLEESSDTGKSLYITGIFAQSDIGNRNHRVYPKTVLENEINRYRKEVIAKDSAVGELGHPEGPSINLDRVCLVIKELEQDGSNFIGKAKVASTPHGNIVRGLINDGVKLGVSTRAMGSLSKRSDGLMEVGNDLKLVAVDVVHSPSAPDAYVSGLYESADWIFDEKLGWKTLELVEEQKKEISTASRSQLESHKLALFESFLRSL